MQARTLAIRTFKTSTNSNFSITQAALNAQPSTFAESSDLFFSCDDHSAAAAQREYRPLTLALDSLLAKAGANFGLEVTSTLMMTTPPVATEAHQEAMSYKFNLLLARGSSFSH